VVSLNKAKFLCEDGGFFKVSVLAINHIELRFAVSEPQTGCCSSVFRESAQPSLGGSPSQ